MIYIWIRLVWRYARLTESRSTTPSPPPSTTSPLRLRLPKLPFGSREENVSEPSTSAEIQVSYYFPYQLLSVSVCIGLIFNCLVSLMVRVHGGSILESGQEQLLGYSGKDILSSRRKLDVGGVTLSRWDTAREFCTLRLEYFVL